MDYARRSHSDRKSTALQRTAGRAADRRYADEQVEQLDRYRRLLWSWNERMNLTRHTTLEKFVGRDVVDSYQLSKLLERGERVLDVGTGGGVPGVVLAILRPDLSVSLCESTQKKARAVEAIVGELGLHVPVFSQPGRRGAARSRTFDTLVARALAPLRKVLTWLQPHWDAFDRLLLIKGPAWVEERGEARAAWPAARPRTAQGGQLPNARHRRRKRNPQHSTKRRRDSD